MFYAKHPCENLPQIREKSKAKNEFKVVVQFKQIPFTIILTIIHWH